jgi:hypothetical protein
MAADHTAVTAVPALPWLFVLINRQEEATEPET